jgi:hypothetical protein
MCKMSDIEEGSPDDELISKTYDEIKREQEDRFVKL